MNTGLAVLVGAIAGAVLTQSVRLIAQKQGAKARRITAAVVMMSLALTTAFLAAIGQWHTVETIVSPVVVMLVAIGAISNIPQLSLQVWELLKVHRTEQTAEEILSKQRKDDEARADEQTEMLKAHTRALSDQGLILADLSEMLRTTLVSLEMQGQLFIELLQQIKLRRKDRARINAFNRRYMQFIREVERQRLSLLKRRRGVELAEDYDLATEPDEQETGNFSLEPAEGSLNRRLLKAWQSLPYSSLVTPSRFARPSPEGRRSEA